MDPYLPDIMQSVVAKVSTILQSTFSFAAFFDKGNQSQVSKSIHDNKDHFPLVWLKMPFTVKRGNHGIFGKVRTDLILAMPTENTYTQQQRDTLVYKPYLLPLYEALIKQIAIEKMFSFSGPESLAHDQVIMPYWGGGAINGTDNMNLFEKNIDAIGIIGLEINIRNKNNCP